MALHPRNSKYEMDYNGCARDIDGKMSPEIDWAKLFPVPVAGAAARADSDSESEEIGWFLSPRVAYRLHWHAMMLHALMDGDLVDDDVNGNFHVDEDDNGLTSIFNDDLPPVVRPAARDWGWRRAFMLGINRMAQRLEKGMQPSPNCTAEEMGLHWIINGIDSSSIHDDEKGTHAKLPKSVFDGVDGDAELVEHLLQDSDVIMLFDMPNLAFADEATVARMRIANLNPEDWFKPFKAERVHDHE